MCLKMVFKWDPTDLSAHSTARSYQCHPACHAIQSRILRRDVHDENAALGHFRWVNQISPRQPTLCFWFHRFPIPKSQMITSARLCGFTAVNSKNLGYKCTYVQNPGCLLKTNILCVPVHSDGRPSLDLTKLLSDCLGSLFKNIKCVKIDFRLTLELIKTFKFHSP